MCDFEINDFVILNTDVYGSIEGLIIGYNKGKTRYTLQNVICIATSKPLKGAHYIYKNSIISGATIKRSLNDSLCSSDMSTSTDTSRTEDPLEGTSLDNLNCMKNISKRYRFVQWFDRAYTDALLDLNQQEYIGFIAEDSEFRSKILHIFAMSTPDHIYLFDMLSLGNMKSDMKQLLESKSIKKITFNSGRLGDCLKHHYNVILDGVFDVQLADAYITKIKTDVYPSTLLTYEDCVSRYLKIPAQLYIKKPLQPENGKMRPLSNSFKAQLAQNVSFMQSLSIKLYGNIMGPLYSACNYRTNSVRIEDDIYEAGMKVANDDSLTEDIMVAFNDHDIE